MTTVTGTHPISHTEARRLPRTTGALSGLLIILLGLWGGLVPFFGPYFHYAFGSYQTWHYTSERLWLCIIPGAVAVVGGLMLLRSAHRTSGLLGGWLALAAGAWFAIGPTISLLWHAAGDPIGAPIGGHTRQAIEWLGYFSGLGVLIAALAAFAMGRYYSRPRVVEEAVAGDAALAEEAAVAHHEERVGAEQRAGAESPVAGTAAEPVAARDEPLAGREPLAAREEPLAARADEPVAARDEPLAGREPVADRDEPVAAGEPETEPEPEPEPLAAREPAAPAAAEPAGAATAESDAPASAGSQTSTDTYRRRPGLSRFRR
jgi:hypothetical protein